MWTAACNIRQVSKHYQNSYFYLSITYNLGQTRKINAFKSGCSMKEHVCKCVFQILLPSLKSSYEEIHTSFLVKLSRSVFTCFLVINSQTLYWSLLFCHPVEFCKIAILKFLQYSCLPILRFSFDICLFIM